MSRLSRRRALQTLATAVATTRVIGLRATQETHVHDAVQTVAPDGPYKPKALTQHEYETVDRLTDLILPADGNDPGAKAAGAAAWIDSMAAENDQLLTIYTSGLAWMDHAMRERGYDSFLVAPESTQTAFLDALAYKKNRTDDLGPGARFFDWVRRMTVDAFYTSEMGTKSLGYVGNAYLREFSVPPNVMEYVNKQSPI